MAIFESIKTALSGLGKGGNHFDPSSLQDEIAMKTKWIPAKSGGTNFCTHVLEDVSADRVEFSMTTMATIFPGIFILVGLSTMIATAIAGIKEDSMAFIGVPFGGLFFLIGFLILRSWMTPRIFDKRVGFYWKGKKDSNQVDMREIKENCALRDIHAIQLLQEYCRNNSSRSGGSSYYSYEINLVLKDGERINIMDHGKRSVIIRDAEKLARFLEVPLWSTIH